ncbi:MAG: hypothetical protein AAGK02_06425, partial [Pseudomonadota bacterium]
IWASATNKSSMMAIAKGKLYGSSSVIEFTCKEARRNACNCQETGFSHEQGINTSCVIKTGKSYKFSISQVQRIIISRTLLNSALSMPILEA